MMENDQHAEGIKQSIDDILGADTFLKPKKKTDDDVQREKFEKIIRTLDEIGVRASILENELKLDLSSYDEHFYSVIENLLELHFGKDICELIFFYLYDRMNPDGSLNELFNDEGEVISLSSPNDLWYVIKMTQERSNKKKK